MRHRTGFAILSVLIVCVGISSVASGQTTRPDDDRRAQPTTQPSSIDAEPWGPLGGPRVSDRSAPGVRMGFGGTAQRFGDRGNGNLQIYRRILSTMELAPDQEEAIQALIQEFGEATRSYNRTHARELAALRGTLRDNGFRARSRRDQDRATGDDAAPERDVPMTEERQATIEATLARQREIRMAGPRQEDVMVDIFNLLTPSQQKELDDEIIRLAEEARRERDARALEAMEPAQPDAQPNAESDRPAGRDAPRPTDRATDRSPAEIRRLLDADESELTRAERRLVERIRARQKREQDRLTGAPKPPTKHDIDFEDEG